MNLLDWVLADVLLAERYCKLALYAAKLGNADEAEAMRLMAEKSFQRAEEIAERNANGTPG